MQSDHVHDEPVEVALRRDHRDGPVDDLFDVVLDERQRVHRRDKDASVPAVAVIHDVPDAVTDLDRAIDHTGGHYSGKIGLDLEIDIIGRRVIEPVA